MSDGTYTPGPWEMWTSCSWRRIGTPSGQVVCEPTTQPSDGHPDLHFPNGGCEGPDARLMLAAPALYEALRDLVERHSRETRDNEGPLTREANTEEVLRRARAALKLASLTEDRTP